MHTTLLKTGSGKVHQHPLLLACVLLCLCSSGTCEHSCDVAHGWIKCCSCTTHELLLCFATKQVLLGCHCCKVYNAIPLMSQPQSWHAESLQLQAGQSLP